MYRLKLNQNGRELEVKIYDDEKMAGRKKYIGFPYQEAGRPLYIAGGLHPAALWPQALHLF